MALSPLAALSISGDIYVLLVTLRVCVISWVVINLSPRYILDCSFEHQVRTS